jgi:hypothetical protein
MYIHLRFLNCKGEGIALSVQRLGNELDNRGTGFDSQYEQKYFYFSQCPDRLWCDPTSYPMGTGGSFRNGKAVEASK